MRDARSGASARGEVGVDDLVQGRRPSDGPRDMLSERDEQPSSFELLDRLERREIGVPAMAGEDRSQPLEGALVEVPFAVHDGEYACVSEQLRKAMHGVRPVEPMDAVAGDDHVVRGIERRVLDGAVHPAQARRVAAGRAPCLREHRLRHVHGVHSLDVRREPPRELTRPAAGVEHRPARGEPDELGDRLVGVRWAHVIHAHDVRVAESGPIGHAPRLHRSTLTPRSPPRRCVEDSAEAIVLGRLGSGRTTLVLNQHKRRSARRRQQ